MHKISRVSRKCCGWEDKNYDSLFYYCVKAKKERWNTNTKDGYTFSRRNLITIAKRMHI